MSGSRAGTVSLSGSGSGSSSGSSAGSVHFYIGNNPDGSSDSDSDNQEWPDDENQEWPDDDNPIDEQPIEFEDSSSEDEDAHFAQEHEKSPSARTK